MEGIYDEASDEALLVVTREDIHDATNTAEQGDATGQSENENELAEPGGFFREGEDPFLLRTRVGKADPYSRQQGEYKLSLSRCLKMPEKIHLLTKPFLDHRNVDCMDGAEWDGRRSVISGSRRLQ